MYKRYVMEAPGKSDSDPDEQINEDSEKSPSEETLPLEETQDKEDNKEGEAAQSDPDAPEGSSPSEDSNKSTELEETEREKKKNKPGEVMDDEKKASDGSFLRRALTRSDEDSDSLSSDSRKSSSEESVQDTEQKEDHEEREAAESGPGTPGDSSKDSEKSTESEESEKKRKNAKSGEVTEDEKRAPDGSILRRALTRPNENSDLSTDSRKSSSEESVQLEGTEQKEREAEESGINTPDGSSKDSDKSTESGESEKERKKVKPGEVTEDEKRPPHGSILRRALTRPEEDIDNLSTEVRVGDSRAPSEVPSPSEVRVGGDSSSTPPEVSSPIPIGPPVVVTGVVAAVVDSPILRSALTRPEDDVDKASTEVIVGDSRNPSEAPSSPIEEIEELEQSEEASVQDLTSADPPEPSPPSEAGRVEPLPVPSSAQAAETDPNEESVSVADKYPILTRLLEDSEIRKPNFIYDSAATTNETSIESISSTPPTSGDEIRNEGILVEAQYILAPRRTPPSTDDTSSEGIPDNMGNGARYVYTSSEGEVNNEENPDVPLPRPSPEVPEDIPIEENEARASSASSAISTSSNSPNSTRSSGSSTNSTSSSAEEGSSNGGGSTGHASGGSSPNEPTSTNRKSTDTRPNIPDTGSNEALPRIMEATTEEEEAAARADSTPTTPRKIFGENQVREANAPERNDEPLTVTITTSASSIPPASPLTRSPVSRGTRQISPASRSTVKSPRVPPMPDLIIPVRPSTATSISCSPQNQTIPPNASVSEPPGAISGTASVTAPASSVSPASRSSTSMPSAPSVTSPSRSETRASNPPVAGSKRKITPAVEPPIVPPPPSSSPVRKPPQPLSTAGALPASPPPPSAPPFLASPHAPAPANQSPLRSPVPKKRQRQQYHEGAPPSAAVTLSGMPCIDPNEFRPEAPTPRQGTKRRTSDSDEAAVAGPSGSDHGGWRSKRSREDEDDDIPELDINPRPPLEPPVHKISDDDSGAESGDDLLRATPPNQVAASDDDDGIAGIVPLMPRRPPNQENGDPKKARILKNQETDIEIMIENVDWLGGFGLKFVGGSDTWIVGPAVVVYDIELESPAFDDRRIIVGDQIRAVSGVRITEDMTYTQIFELLSVIGTSLLLKIYRPDPIAYDRIIVTLKAEEGTAFGDNFGLRISSTFLFSNFGSMYIDGFDESSVADLDGRLKRGDFLETINDHDMLTATHPSAAFALCARPREEGATIVCKRFKISN